MGKAKAEADLDRFPVSLFLIVLAGVKEKTKTEKDAAKGRISDAGFASTTNPRAKFNRVSDMNREMRWCQIAGNASIENHPP